jgi:homopolymeric O-antigen transport system ATP-binding protein
MSSVVIRAEHLGKKYTIRHQRTQQDSDTLRSALGQRLEAVWDRASGLARGHAPAPIREIEEYWALKDASFEVRHGEVTGIIGRNGAGKSTLLKLLSGITEPTEGFVEVEGQVASLLEVGTGFHPELTGRENIFLNGAILGMSRAEVRKKFDAIVEFAAIEQFLDTPVKRYSSGMYVRLAFSVSAHLEPDILIVDEVLAVGDAEFQKKCIGKVEEVVKSDGRTILLVSHNMGIVTALCRNAILLERGQIATTGPAHEVVSSYYASGRGTSFSVDLGASASKAADRGAWLMSAQIQDMSGQPKGEINVRAGCKVVMRYRVGRDLTKPVQAVFRFWSSEGQCAFVSAQSGDRLTRGDYQAECTIPADLLNCGIYFVDAALADTGVGEPLFFDEKSILSLVGVESTGDPQGIGVDFAHAGVGVLRPKLDWTIKPVG